MCWYSHLFKNFPEFMIHTVEGFGIVNKAEIDVFLELSCFFDDPANIGNLISGSSAFSKRKKFTLSENISVCAFKKESDFDYNHNTSNYTAKLTIISISKKWLVLKT